MKSVLVLLALLLLSPLSVDAAAPAVPADQCAAAPEFSTPDERLSALAASVAANDPIEILAIGSGTTVGQDGGGGDAFPRRMVVALRDALPGHEIHLTLRGSRGATAAEMLKLMQDELTAQHFTLVLWQTGTVEALRGTPPVELRHVLDEGIALTRAAGTDLILIDSQFTRAMAEKVDERAYLAVMRNAAEGQGVVLFRRYDLMKSWVADGRNLLDNVRKADRERAIDAVHACIAEVLVRFVSHGAGVPIR